MYWNGAFFKTTMFLYLCVLKHQHTVKTGRCPKSELSQNCNSVLTIRHDGDIVTKQMKMSSQDPKLFAVLGLAGSGKSAMTQAMVLPTMRHGERVLLSAPTGMLTTTIRQKFPEVDVDTVHAAIPRHDHDFAGIRFRESRRNRTVVKFVFDRILSVWEESQKVAGIANEHSTAQGGMRYTTKPVFKKIVRGHKETHRYKRSGVSHCISNNFRYCMYSAGNASDTLCDHL